MMRFFFVWDGAQHLLSNPAYQSSKFLKVFLEIEPLPRMFAGSYFIWEGFAVCGLFLAGAFLIVNPGLKGGWLRKALSFGLLHWLLMVPWFEFYLPYNVMHESLPLVLFEALLWMATNLATAVVLSFILNFSVAEKVK